MNMRYIVNGSTALFHGKEKTETINIGGDMNYFVLIGIAIIIVGFIFKLDVVAVVLISGLVTGLIAKMGLVEVLNAIGTGFVNNH